MAVEFNFGSFAGPKATRQAAQGQPFRLALLGDFSGGANAGRLDTGAALAGQKPLRIDVDNFDRIFQRLAPSLKLQLGEDAASIPIPLTSLDDFHPDQLFE